RVLVRFSNTSEWEFDDPKTESSKRTIPLSPSLTERLSCHLETVEARKRVASNWREHDLVFPNNSGEPIHEDTLRRLFKQNVELAGLDPKKYRQYDLRHSCATLLLLKREHPKVVQERLGHSSIAITLDLYSHFIPSMQEDATNSLSELLYGESGTPSAHQPPALPDRHTENGETLLGFENMSSHYSEVAEVS
ncbi:MAG TPA: site-specific integrase, partial [Pyrinomonadaceae bacterium]|nr:site-specific integrase [Pyrinomonadaceae bacterium]